MKEELQTSNFKFQILDFEVPILRALSSGGERLLHTQEVRGSNPLAPTMVSFLFSLPLTVITLMLQISSVSPPFFKPLLN